jgi:hypothetical protein
MSYVRWLCLLAKSGVDYMSRMVVSNRRQEMFALNIMGDWVHARFVMGSVLLIVY